MKHLYDEIGSGYASRRRPDPGIAKYINKALDNAVSIVNVGAGTGSYEPDDSFVIAVEPSLEMIRQRRPDSAPVVRARAETLPFQNKSFSTALAILTVHHWSDRKQGLAELARVAGERIVIVTFDPDETSKFWLVSDYFPEIANHDYLSLPYINEISDVLGDMEIVNIPVPGDCSDGFLCAYWKRPHAYLEENVRNSISVFSKLENTGRGLARLKEELDSGAWRDKYGYLLDQSELDIGYRLITVNL